MQISVKSNVTEIAKTLDRKYKKQIPFAASRALNDVAFAARKEANLETNKVFKGGAVAFTRRAFRYKKSHKTRLSSEVFVGPDHDYMAYQIEGGTRFPDSKFVRVNTTHTKLNKYGNVTRARMQQMITNKAKYFTGTPKGMPDAGDGIWERYGRKTKSGGQRIRMVASFQEKASYRPKFPFEKIVQGVVADPVLGFSARFASRIAAASRTAK
jgi:hypothetical protein